MVRLLYVAAYIAILVLAVLGLIWVATNVWLWL